VFDTEIRKKKVIRISFLLPDSTDVSTQLEYRVSAIAIGWLNLGLSALKAKASITLKRNVLN